MPASNLHFIIAAYAVSWVVILGYMVRLIRKGARADAEFTRLTSGARTEERA